MTAETHVTEEDAGRLLSLLRAVPTERGYGLGFRNPTNVLGDALREACKWLAEIQARTPRAGGGASS